MFSLSKKFLVLLTIGLWSSICVLSIGLQFNFSDGLDLFAAKGNYPFTRYIQEIIIYFLGNCVVFLLPGLIWICAFFKKKFSLPVLLFYSFLVSVISLISITTAFKISVHGELNWLNFVIILGILTLSGLMVLFSKKTLSIDIFNFSRKNIVIGVILMITMVACAWVFQDKIIWVDYDNNFAVEHILSIPLGAQSDLLENFGLIDSLKKHLLPYWDLEYADRFGYPVVDPPLHFFRSLFLMLFFGSSFGVQSLNSLIVILINFWIIWQISSSSIEHKGVYWTSLTIPFLFLMYILVFLGHPDSALVLVHHIHFMCLFTIAQFFCLVKRRNNLFLIFALLAFLTKYEAMLFTFLGLWFYARIFETEKGETATLLRKYMLLILPYIILMLAIGIFRGDLGTYAEIFFVERFMRLDYFNMLPIIFSQESTSGWSQFSIHSTVDFLKYFIVGSAFLGFVIFLPQKDKTPRFFSRIAIVYFLIIIISREKRIHYISPLVFLSTFIALRMVIHGCLKKGKILKILKSNKGVV